MVWIHGGAWLSGGKEYIANYLKILAGKGYTTIGVGYSLAPGHQYPTPLQPVNAALAYLVKQAAKLHVNPTEFILAGDSAGAQIAAQLANMISVRSYAEIVGLAPAIERSQLRGAILYCGPYDLETVNFDGGFGHFVRTAMWAYSGSKDFLQLPHLTPFSVLHYVTAEFPPTFISAGNGDPLLPQSHALANRLARRGVAVDSLFFQKITSQDCRTSTSSIWTTTRVGVHSTVPWPSSNMCWLLIEKDGDNTTDRRINNASCPPYYHLRWQVDTLRGKATTLAVVSQVRQGQGE